MESKLQSMASDRDYYTKSFNTFALYSEKYELFEKASWLQTFRKEAVANIRTKLEDHEELRILGVGSGSGEVECLMLAELLHRFPRINNRVVEPAHRLILRYKALAQSKSRELQGVTFDWREQTIEQYEKEGDSTKFHFISAVHTLYHVGDVNSSLMDLYDHLEPDGILLVIILSDDNGIWRLRNRFFFLERPGVHFTNSALVQNFFDRRKISYTKYHQPSRLNITKCFDEASEDGKLLMDFLFLVAKFKETVSEDVQTQVMEYITSSEVSETSGDEIFVSNDWDAIFVTKLTLGANTG